ncbi:MAG: hypothetical protein WAU69_15985 [Solirubrobacteraceae bacterium]
MSAAAIVSFDPALGVKTLRRLLWEHGLDHQHAVYKTKLSTSGIAETLDVPPSRMLYQAGRS